MMAECFCLCFYLFNFTSFVLPSCFSFLWSRRRRKTVCPPHKPLISPEVVNTRKKELEVWGTIFCFGIFTSSFKQYQFAFVDCLCFVVILFLLLYYWMVLFVSGLFMLLCQTIFRKYFLERKKMSTKFVLLWI